MEKLNAVALGLSIGIIWALFLAVFTVVAFYTGYGTAFVELMGSVYYGVTVSLKGAVFALPWAFVDGFIGGFLVGWLYNKLA